MSVDQVAAAYEARVAAVPKAARQFAEDAWGETWAHAEMGSLLDFAALAAPAAKGGTIPPGWKLVPAEATRDWAYALSVYRQGRSEVPRTEGPTQRDIDWGVDRIREILASAPALPAEEGNAADIIQSAVTSIAELGAKQSALHGRAWVAAEYRVAGSPHEWTDEDALAMARFILAGPKPATSGLRRSTPLEEISNAVATLVMRSDWATQEPSGDEEADTDEHCRRHEMVQEAALAALRDAPPFAEDVQSRATAEAAYERWQLAHNSDVDAPLPPYRDVFVAGYAAASPPRPAGAAGGGSGDLGALSAGSSAVVGSLDWGTHDVRPNPHGTGRWCARCGVLETTCSLEGNLCRPLYAGAKPYGGRAPTPVLGAQGEPVAWKVAQIIAHNLCGYVDEVDAENFLNGASKTAQEILTLVSSASQTARPAWVKAYEAECQRDGADFDAEACIAENFPQIVAEQQPAAQSKAVARDAVLAVVRAAWALVDNTGVHDLLPLAVNRDDWNDLAARFAALKSLLPADELPADPPHAVAYFWPTNAALSEAPAAPRSGSAEELRRRVAIILNDTFDAAPHRIGMAADAIVKEAALLQASRPGETGDGWEPIETAPDDESRDWTADLPHGADSGLGWATWDDDETFAFLTWWEDLGGGRSRASHWRRPIAGPAPSQPHAAQSTASAGGRDDG